jgi:uncharacterized SAM-binding protein YcdF (DUF218 family)
MLLGLVIFCVFFVIFANSSWGRSMVKASLRLAVNPLVEDASRELDQMSVDRIVVLIGGDSTDRADRAVEVFQRQKLLGREVRVTAARPEDSDFVSLGMIPDSASLLRTYLQNVKGLSPDALDFVAETRNSSTWEELLSLRAHFENQDPKPKHIVLVTRWWHTARSGWVARKAFSGSGIKVSLIGSGLDPGGRVGDWWRSEMDVIGCWVETLKWAWYLVRY